MLIATRAMRYGCRAAAIEVDPARGVVCGEVEEMESVKCAFPHWPRKGSLEAGGKPHFLAVQRSSSSQNTETETQHHASVTARQRSSDDETKVLPLHESHIKGLESLASCGRNLGDSIVVPGCSNGKRDPKVRSLYVFTVQIAADSTTVI